MRADEGTWGIGGGGTTIHVPNGFCGSSQVFMAISLKVGYDVGLRSRFLLYRDASQFGLAVLIARLSIWSEGSKVRYNGRNSVHVYATIHPNRSQIK